MQPQSTQQLNMSYNTIDNEALGRRPERPFYRRKKFLIMIIGLLAIGICLLIMSNLVIVYYLLQTKQPQPQPQKEIIYVLNNDVNVKYYY